MAARRCRCGSRQAGRRSREGCGAGWGARRRRSGKNKESAARVSTSQPYGGAAPPSGIAASREVQQSGVHGAPAASGENKETS